jgi:hypothetical protein
MIPFMSYDSILAAAEGIRKANSVNGDNIVAALETIDIPGSGAPRINFSNQTGSYMYHCRPLSFAVIQFDPVTHKLFCIWPEQYAERQIMKPPS